MSRTSIAVSLGLAMLTVPAANAIAQDLDCIIMNRRQPPGARPSPLDSVSFSVDGHAAKICYGSPSARGRTMIGGEHVPFGEIWRTGANEPTMIHTTVALDIAGISIPAGTYTMYSVPGATEWQIVLNGSITQWGHERNYTGDVAAQEIGRAPVAMSETGEHVESFRIRAEPTDAGVNVVLEWENTRVVVPIRRG